MIVFTRRSLFGQTVLAPLASLLPLSRPPAAPVYVRPGEAVPFDVDNVKAEVNTLLKADGLLGRPARSVGRSFANAVNDLRAGDLHRRVLKALVLGRGDPVALANAALVTEEMYCEPGGPG